MKAACLPSCSTKSHSDIWCSISGKHCCRRAIVPFHFYTLYTNRPHIHHMELCISQLVTAFWARGILVLPSLAIAGGSVLLAWISNFSVAKPCAVHQYVWYISFEDRGSFPSKQQTLFLFTLGQISPVLQFCGKHRALSLKSHAARCALMQPVSERHQHSAHFLGIDHLKDVASDPVIP